MEDVRVHSHFPLSGVSLGHKPNVPLAWRLIPAKATWQDSVPQQTLLGQTLATVVVPVL